MPRTRILLAFGSLLLMAGTCFGQATSAKPAAKPAAPSAAEHKTPVPWKRYCQPENGFCFKYPASWSVLGQVFEGNGVVVAPEQKIDRTLWNEITVGLVVPPPEGDEEAVELDKIIEQTMSSLREEGQGFETLQRQRRTVAHNPAQMLKVRYKEKTSDRNWCEEIIFIQGPDDEIYSVALKSSLQDLARLEPVLAGVVGSWVLPQPTLPSGDDEEEAAPAKPAAKVPAKPSTPQKPPQPQP